MNSILSVRDLTRTYRQGDTEINAVDHVNLEIFKGDFTAIVGASGSGKTTLLNLIGCIDHPTSGEIFLNDEKTSDMDDDHLATIRRRKIGYIYQDYKLIPILTAEENIIMPLLLDGKKANHEELLSLANDLGITHRLKHLPPELSGGQCQRVSIGRALINHPEIILADEPTGNLDKKSADEIMNLLIELNQRGITILMVTHNEQYASLCKRVLHIADGCLTENAV